MDIRQLRYFVAAIEEGSLHGAAQRMNIAQPALSRRVRELEASLDCALLRRGPRGVTPTPAGTTLYREAVLLLDRFDQAGRRTRRMGLDQDGVVRVGLTPTARKYAFMPRALDRFASEHSNDLIAFSHANSVDLADALRHGRLDLSLLYERHLGSPVFDERLVHRERYVLAVHPDHPLAQAAPLALSDLSGEPLVWLSRRSTEGAHDQLMQQCRLHGLEPVIAHLAHSHGEQIDVTVVSRGACLTPASILLSMPGDMLRFRPLPGFAMEIHLTLAWSHDISLPHGGEVLACLQDAIDEHQAAIAADHADWARLFGHAIVSTGSARAG